MRRQENEILQGLAAWIRMLLISDKQLIHATALARLEPRTWNLSTPKDSSLFVGTLHSAVRGEVWLLAWGRSGVMKSGRPVALIVRVRSERTLKSECLGGGTCGRPPERPPGVT